MLIDRFGVKVVRGQMIAAVDDNAVEIALLPRHPVERVDVGADGGDRHQRFRCVHQELAPRPLDRQRFDLAAVEREPAVLDEAARGEQLERPPVRRAIERNRKVEIARIDPERGAGDRHPFGIAGQLEFGRCRPKLIEDEVAVAQNDDLAIRDAPVHTPRHLQDLVGAEVEAMEHVAAALHDVAVSSVVDHHRVEPADVESGLAGCRHRQKERPLDLTLEKRPNDANRLATVIERRREPLPLLTELLRQTLDLCARGDEDRHAAPLSHHMPDVLLVEEFLGRLRKDLNLRLERWDRTPWSRAPRRCRDSARRTLGSTVALSQMNRQPARFPSARHSSSSADVWWISSTTIVSRAVMRSS